MKEESRKNMLGAIVAKRKVIVLLNVQEILISELNLMLMKRIIELLRLKISGKYDIILLIF